MCGIIGYIGDSNCVNILLEGLKKLEYRGYDSAGIAVVAEDMEIYKKKGGIADLEKLVPKISRTMGIGHTRWATHGIPSSENAHPHTDCTGRIAIVHNGIIDNSISLKKKLEERGHKFISETDSEILAHLIEENYEGDLKGAMLKFVDELKGSFALVAVHSENPDEIVVFKRESPLILGLGQGENLVASDIPALLGHTKNVIYLDENQGAVIGREGIKVFDANGRVLEKEVVQIKWSLKDAEKGGYEHFMVKEIFEQPRAIRESMLSKTGSGSGGHISSLLHKEGQNISSVKIIACGTSYHAGLLGRYIISHLSGIPTYAEVGSEYRYADKIPGDELLIFISQSGETADTIASARECRKMGKMTLAITNVLGSTLTRLVDETIYTNAGPEIGVAASKSFITQILSLYLLGIQLGRVRGLVSPEFAGKLHRQLRKMPRVVEKILENSQNIKNIAKKLSVARTIFFVGRNINYPTAMEGALKLKEISYIHAEGYPAGELKHGPIALLDKNTPVVALAPEDFIYEKMVANIGEIMAREAPVLAITDSENNELEKYVDWILKIPKVDDFLTPIPLTVVLQLLAYHCARARGCSIDKPRNLAKSVTVE